MSGQHLRERRRCLEVLGVQEDATDDDIRKAYRRMARIFHPDKNDSDDAKEKFQEIGYAYKYLTEGPSAVGFEEDGHFTGHAGGHDVPIEVLIRLFPWMTGDFGLSRPSPFGGLFGGHPFSNQFHRSPFQDFFMDPFSGMHGFDDDDDEEEEDIVIMQNGRITIIKPGGGHGYNHKKKNRRRPRQHHDPFHLFGRPDHFTQHFGHSRPHFATNENFHSSRHQHTANERHHHTANDRYHHTANENVHNSRRHPTTNENVHNSRHHHTTNENVHNSRRHPTTNENVHNSSRHHTTNENVHNNRHHHTTSHTSSKDDMQPSHFSRESCSNKNSCSAKRENFPKGTSETPFHSNTESSSKPEEKKSKPKQQTVITSRKERKKQKKAEKKSEKKSATLTCEGDTEEMPYLIESESEDEISIYDNIDDTQVPLKLNKKQRRKLKREREKLEKEIAQSNGDKTFPEISLAEDGCNVSQEVDFDDVISISSASNDIADKDSITDSKSRRTRKNEKKKQKSCDTANVHLFDNLLPRSHEDEEEMVRVAMEMSKMEMDNIEDNCSQFSQSNNGVQKSDSESQRSNSMDQRSDTASQRSSVYDNTSWYDDIGESSSFQKSPMEDMKKIYYKDLTSTTFDPGSYYKSNQPEVLRSGDHHAEKENYDNSYQVNQIHSGQSAGNNQTVKETHDNSYQGYQMHSGQSAGNNQTVKETYDNSYQGNPTGSDSRNNRPLGQRSNGGYRTGYFQSRNYSQPLHQGSSQRSPVESHHQKYFKPQTTSTHLKHSIDLDEPDDIQLNLNENNSRGTPNRNTYVGEVLDSSLNVPKGISINNGNYVYRKK